MTNRIDRPDTPADIKLQKALDDRDAFIMTAGAGSGKTTSLVKGLGYIRERQGQSLNTNRQRVACITYTEIATSEIFEEVGHDELFHVSTIHSFLWQLIKPFTEEIREWLKAEFNEKIIALEESNSKTKTRPATKEKNNIKIDRYKTSLDNIDDILKFRYQANSDISKGILGHADVIKAGPHLLLNNALLRTILSKKYPFFFVDESQDTVEPFVLALIKVREDHQDFCLGFFGDQMQNIYMTGIGTLPDDFGAVQIEKPENFRSPKNILATVNEIRKNGDGLQQTLGREFPEDGTATLFILPQDENRTGNLSIIQNWLAADTKDEKWQEGSEEYDVKQLVIVHRIAANRLGFSNLYSALNDRSTASIKDGLTEGDHWTLRPFLLYILPLIEAVGTDDGFAVINILRKSSPKLNGTLPKQDITKDDLQKLKNSVLDMAKLFNDGESVKTILKHCKDNNLIDLDKRFLPFVEPALDAEFLAELADLMSNISDSDMTKQENVLQAYMNVKATEFIPYEKYISENTPYATQHGIKGAEFERVMVILDDNEGTWSLYSYEKILGLKALSDTDKKNIAENKDSAISRTTRLFYVCCSRAKKDLAIVLFVSDVDAARGIISPLDLVDESRLLTLEQIG